MALIINENKCARCGVCEAECPSQAVVQTEDSYVIDPASCTGCMHYGAPLCEEACPSNAIHKIKPSLYKKCLSLFN